MIGNFDFKLTYHPGSELLQAEALNCIYVQELQSDGSLDPDWPMYYALIEYDIYPTDVLNKTLEKLVKNRSKFKVDQGTVCFKTKDGLLAALYLCHNGLYCPQVPPQLEAYTFKNPIPFYAK